MSSRSTENCGITCQSDTATDTHKRECFGLFRQLIFLLGEAKVKVEQWKIGDVKPYEHNPRINDHAVDAVARSIQEFGFRQPIVVDEDGVIIVGHTRFKAAQKLGLETVPVHVAKGLTPAQVKAYRLADNRTGVTGGMGFRSVADRIVAAQ